MPPFSLPSAGKPAYFERGTKPAVPRATMADSPATAASDASAAPYAASWKEDLRVFLDMVSRARPPMESIRERYADVLNRTLAEEIYPALEEFLSEMTRHGIGGQIYGRGSHHALTLRMDNGFEIAVERDRYRERPTSFTGWSSSAITERGAAAISSSTGRPATG